MSHVNVLVVLPVTGEKCELLASAFPDASFSFVSPRDLTAGDLSAVEVVVGNVPSRLLASAPRLRWVQLGSAGADSYVAPGVLDDSVVLTSCSGAYGQAVSEHVFAMVLAVQKKLELYRDDQRAGVWGEEGEVSSLIGANVLVIGTGDIGGHFCRLATAFGAHVTGARRKAGECPEGFERVIPMERIHDVVPKMDVIAGFVPSTPETRHLVNADLLARCRRGVIVANGGRGDLIVTDDLVDALVSGQVGAAALDVTDPEPLPAGHPLWTLRNALVIPHVSGFWHLPVTLDNVCAICYDNLARFSRGEPLRNVVEREASPAGRSM